MALIEYVFVDHFLPACIAALFFLAGALLAVPRPVRNYRWIQRACHALFGCLLRLFGHRPGLPRTAVTIFLFNGIAIFLYMSAGIRPWIPKLIALATGFTIALAVLGAAELEELFAERRLATTSSEPGPVLALGCSIATIVLELPCFWYAVGMGITLGDGLAGNAGGYPDLFAERAVAYATVLLPVLAISAFCESIAIAGAKKPEYPPDTS
jgi:hypothetical protein